MLKERVSDNVYWFQSETYAQVTAGTIVGPQWAVLIDTLMPSETPRIRKFIESQLMVPVKYIINTHHHADHTWGNCFFPRATILAHTLNHQWVSEKGGAALEQAKKHNPMFKQVKIVPPHLTFSEGEISLRVGKKNLVLMLTPGHSADGISVLVEEDRVLFTGDVFMPLPYVVGGDLEEMTAVIKKIGKMGLENIVQGHGDIVLRGEIEAAVKENLDYLANIKKAAKTAMKRKDPMEYLETVDIESCGKSRVNLGGLAEDLHRRNLAFLYRQMASAEQ